MTLPAPCARRGAAALLAALFAVVLLGGCSTLDPGGPAGSKEGEAAGPPVVQVEIDAPAPLKALLEQHLDLARLARMTRGDAVTETELTRLVDAAPVQVRELLQTEGHFKPELTVRRLPAPAPGQPETVLLRVVPGSLTRVQRVTLQAEGALERDQAAGDARALATLAELRRTWTLPVGQPLRNADWSRAKAALLARLRAAGYAAASFSGTAAEVDREQHGARLFLVVDSGPLFRSGPLQVEGLERQDERTVQALVALAPGTPLTESLLLDVQERLQGAGLFESVAVTADPDPLTAAAAPVRIKLREQPVQVYTVGVGLSANTGPRASVEHVYRRVFGHAVTSNNKFELGQVRQVWTGEVSTHPVERARRWLLGGAIERLVSDDDVVLSQRLRAGRSQGMRDFEQLAFAEVERGERRTDAAKTSTFALSGNLHLVLRRLDSALLPTEGYTVSLQGGLGRSRGSDARSGFFGRAYGRVTVYRPLGRSWYGQARLEAGQVFLPSGVAGPESQLFRAGGDDSVRGYAYRSLGPTTDGVVGSGPVMMTASLELARPFVEGMPSLWGALFVDAGRAGRNFGTLDPALGFGAGVRWRSPVGPLRLDIAWGQETAKARVHFSVGIAF